LVAVQGPVVVKAGQINQILTATTMHQSELMVQR
jgi:hypothetical protein